jgi:hypothetical protein
MHSRGAGDPAPTGFGIGVVRIAADLGGSLIAGLAVRSAPERGDLPATACGQLSAPPHRQALPERLGPDLFQRRPTHRAFPR